MKTKILFLFFISSFFIFLIYNFNYQKQINILSINSLFDEENYNKYLSEYLNNSKLNYNLNIDYSSSKLEIENLNALLSQNKNEINSKINSSDVLIISLGNIDILTEDYQEILNELKELFKHLRLINSKEIIFISPCKIKSTTLIKELCHKYNILFINGSSFINKPNLLAQMIYRKIETQFDIVT